MKSFCRIIRLWEAIILRFAAICGWLWIPFVLFLLCISSPEWGLLITVCLVVGMIDSQKKRAGRSTHGSAAWATLSELEWAGCLFRKNGIRLGLLADLPKTSLGHEFRALLTYPLRRSEDAVVVSSWRKRRGRPVSVYLSPAYPHYAIFGSSGGGKTTCYAVPVLLEYRGSMVVLDVKGELAKLTAMHRHVQFGQEIVVIDPFGVATGCGFRPARFNPLDLYRGQPYRILDDARRIAGALVVSTGQEHDPFWNANSRTIITAVLAFLMADARSTSSLNHLRDIISTPRLMDEMIQHMAQSESCGGLLKRLAGQLQFCTGQTKQSAFAVANSHIDFLDSLPLAETLCESTFDPNRLLTGRMTIFVCLPVDRISELAGMQRVILSSLINLAFSAGEDPNREIRFLLDEAATLGRLDTLYNALQFGRSFGLKLTFLFQSNSQIERCFPESQKDDFMATVASVYCATNDYRTAKEISDYIGQCTILSRSDQQSTNWGGNQSTSAAVQTSGSSWGGGTSVTWNEVGRLLIRPEEVLQLPRRYSIVLLPGLRPMLTEKLPYYQKIRRPNGLLRVFHLGRCLLGLIISAVLIPAVLWTVAVGPENPQVRAFWKALPLSQDVHRELPRRRR